MSVTPIYVRKADVVEESTSEFDVVVLGSGAAGLTAALAASDLSLIHI